MGAYNNTEPAFAGLVHDIKAGNRRTSTWRAGEQLGFGIGAFGYEGDDVNVYSAKQDEATITLDADFVASNVITTTVTIDGVAQSPVATTWVDTHDNMMDAHKADLEAAISGLVVTLTDSVDNRQFTLLYKGGNINTVVSVVTLGASQAGITIGYGTAQIFLGVTQYTAKATVDNVGVYEEDDAVNVLEIGKIWVEVNGAVNANTDAFCIMTIGSDQSKFNGTDTNYVTNAKFRSTVAAAGIALLELRGQNTDTTL